MPSWLSLVRRANHFVRHSDRPCHFWFIVLLDSIRLLSCLSSVICLGLAVGLLGHYWKQSDFKCFHNHEIFNALRTIRLLPIKIPTSILSSLTMYFFVLSNFVLQFGRTSSCASSPYLAPTGEVNVQICCWEAQHCRQS